MAGRKRAQNVRREPNGQAVRSMAPTQAQIARAAFSRPELGTPYGLAHVAGNIDAKQYEMAKRVDRIVANYRRAILAKGIASPSVERAMGGGATDPDCAAGRDATMADIHAVERYSRLRDRLMMRGKAVCEATLDFCAGDYCDWQRVQWAYVGLAQLVADEAVGNRRQRA